MVEKEISQACQAQKWYHTTTPTRLNKHCSDKPQSNKGKNYCSLFELEVPIKIIIPRHYAPKILKNNKKKYILKRISQGNLSSVLLCTHSYSSSELKHSTNECLSPGVFIIRLKFLSSQEATNSKSFRSWNLDGKQQVQQSASCSRNSLPQNTGICTEFVKIHSSHFS